MAIGDTRRYRSLASAYPLFVFALLLPAIGLIAAGRGTTIQGSTFNVVASVAFAAMTVTLPLWIHVFLPRNDLPFVPRWNLKHDSPGKWVALHISIGLMALASVSYLNYQALLSLGQRIEGVRGDSTASVVEYFLVRRSPNGCVQYVVLLLDDQDEASICVNRWLGESLSITGLEVGATARIDTVTNLLGTFATAIHAVPASERANKSQEGTRVR